MYRAGDAAGDLSGADAAVAPVGIRGKSSAAYIAAMSGNLAPDYALALGWTSPVSARLLAAGDFGGHAGTDLAALEAVPAGPISGTPLRVFMFVQDGAGVLQPPVEYALPENLPAWSIYGMEPGDFNGDGRTDLVFTSSAPGVFLLLSNASGAYEWRYDDWANLPLHAPGKVADIDGDGHLDVLTSGGFNTERWQEDVPDTRLIHFGDGLGNFTRHRAESADGKPSGFVFGDFDADGLRDLAEVIIGSDSQEHARVHRNDGSGTFLSPRTLDLGAEQYAYPLSGVDFSGDMADDLVLSGGWHVLVHKQLPDGTLQRMPTRFGASAGRMARVLDVDGNGLADLVYPDDYATAAVVHLQDEYGLRQRRKFPFVLNNNGNQLHPQALAAADFNGDGVNDVAIASASHGIYLLHGSLKPYLGAGSVPGPPSVGTPVLQPVLPDPPEYLVHLDVGVPSADGGEAVTGYSVFSVPSGVTDLDAGTLATTHRLIGLPDNASYTFYARAHNAAGLGPPSALSPPLVLGTPDDPGRAPALRIESYSRNESDVESDDWPFTVRLDRPAPPGGLTFEVSVVAGSATPGLDYAFASPGTVTIGEGLLASRPIVIELIGDLLDEDDETLTVHLTNVRGAAATSYSGTMTILDDDMPGARMAIAGSRVQEGDSGVQTAYATVYLSEPQAIPVTFAVSSFCYMCDYYDGVVEHVRFWQKEFTIPVGQTSFKVPVLFDADTRPENDECIDIEIGWGPNSTPGIQIATYSGTLVCMINDDPLPTLSISDASVAEGAQGQVSLTFRASLSAPLQREAEFTLRTVDGSAREGSDYVGRLMAGLVIPAGETSIDFVVQAVGDVHVEPDETFSVRIEDAHNVEVSDGVGVGTLRNDDAANALSVDDAQVIEGNSGQTQLLFNIRLSEPAASDVYFDVHTATGSAHEPQDYLAQSANGLVIPAGSTLRTFSVPVNGDAVVEPHETMVLEVTNVAGAAVTKSQGLGRILNDDVPSLSLGGGVTVTERNEGQTATALFPVTLSAATTTPVVFEARIVPITTTPGLDHNYSPVPSASYSMSSPPTTITIDAGRTSKMVEIMVFGDNVAEPTETYTVDIKAVSGATVAVGSALGTIIDNDASASTAGAMGTKVLKAKRKRAVTHDLAR
jgi:hypothetical protein